MRYVSVLLLAVVPGGLLAVALGKPVPVPPKAEAYQVGLLRAGIEIVRQHQEHIGQTEPGDRPAPDLILVQGDRAKHPWLPQSVVLSDGVRCRVEAAPHEVKFTGRMLMVRIEEFDPHKACTPPFIGNVVLVGCQFRGKAGEGSRIERPGVIFQLEAGWTPGGGWDIDLLNLRS